MPKDITMKSKEVENSDKNNCVLQLYKNALLTRNMLAEDSKEASSLTLGDAQDVQGLWARIKRGVGTLISTQLSGITKYRLPEIRVKLDPPATSIRESYIISFQAIMQKELATDKKTYAKIVEAMDSTTIADHRVLVYEIFSRLVTVALSSELDQLGKEAITKEGNNITDVIDQFIAKLKEHVRELLGNDAGISPLCKFLLFSTQHSQSITDIKQMAWILRQLHLPRDTFTACLNVLSNLQDSIIGYIAAYYDTIFIEAGMPAIITDEAVLKAENVKSTIILCENTVLQTEKSKDSIVEFKEPEKYLSALNAEILSERHTNIIKMLQTAAIKERKKYNQGLVEYIKFFYTMLNTTNLLHKTIACFDMLVTAGGWIPFLTNMVQANNLARMFQNFTNKFEPTCTLCEQKITSFNKDIQFALASCSSLGENLDRMAVTIPTKINCLSDQRIRHAIYQMVKSHIAQLVELQVVLQERELLARGESLINVGGNRQLMSSSSELKMASASSASTSSTTSQTSVTVEEMKSDDSNVVIPIRLETALQLPTTKSTVTTLTASVSQLMSEIKRTEESTAATMQHADKAYSTLEKLMAQFPECDPRKKASASEASGSSNATTNSSSSSSSTSSVSTLQPH